MGRGFLLIAAFGGLADASVLEARTRRGLAPSGSRRLGGLVALRGIGGGAHLELRGGSTDDDDDDDEEQEEEEEEEDAEDMGDFEDDEDAVSESDFDEENLISKTRKLWRATPPLTQVYVGASLSMTLLSFVAFNNKYPEFLNLEWAPVLKRGQIWRPITAFLNYGPFGLNYLLTINFVWSYMSILEKLSYSEPWEFAMMLLFGMSSLLVGTGLGGMKIKSNLGHNMTCFLVYIWARTYEGQEIGVLEFFTIKAELLPWFFVAQTYIFENEVPFHDLLGIAIGHLYTVVRQRKILVAPAPLVSIYTSRPKLMARYEAMAEEFT